MCIFKSLADCLVNPVNMKGVMGAGLALQFKKRFPENYRIYRKWCQTAQPGEVLVTREAGKWICNVPTKIHWKDKADLQLIKSGVASMVTELNKAAIETVAVPELGCGLGGLKWEDVEPVICAELIKFDGIVYWV